MGYEIFTRLLNGLRLQGSNGTPVMRLINPPHNRPNRNRPTHPGLKRYLKHPGLDEQGAHQLKNNQYTTQ